MKVKRTEEKMSDLGLDEYGGFVESVTSDVSESFTKLKERVHSLEKDEPMVNMSLLMTSALGLSSETGEFNEIIKKMLFQGKPLTEENMFHMKRELGDVLWYWVNACRALGLRPSEVMGENVEKLRARFPSGTFSVEKSENRRKGDL
jgi:NTP pyrophosphatase (non-canonical NTP hydrolase)